MKQRTLLAAIAMFAVVAVAPAATIYGLTTRDQLVTFDSTAPMALTNARFISGMDANESMLGIDIRPVNGVIYGLGSFGNLYTVNAITGAATKVAQLTDSITGGALALDGVEFGFDFNPTVDRIRMTSDRGQNFRINPITGVTVVDGTLNQAAGTPNIVGSAYTNNDTNPNTGTTLYNIDSVSDQLTIQAPPNNGTQTNVGGLGVDVTALVGFDILTVGAANTAYAALQAEGTVGSSLYTLDLATGAASLIGAIGTSQTSDSLAIRDITVDTVPEPGTIIALLSGAAAIAARRRRKS
jgi:hypothetical protein